MECNKDDALRAKEIAEKKFMERDYAGARRFVLKAQNLFPALEGLADMLSTLDVYISAENKICGEADWYGILGVNPWDDDEAVRKQYRKLALVLHPDKNKSIGAEGAFKLLLEAWSLLSDKSKRLTYNQKRNSRVVQQSSNGFYSNKMSTNLDSNNRVNVASVPSQPRRKNDTFWTICNRCKTHYEYLRVYLNHTLLCPNCQEAFYAVEKAPPPHVFKPSNSHSNQSHRNSRRGTSIPTNDSSSRQQSINFSMSAPSASQGSGVLQHDQLKRRRMENDYHQTYSYGSDQVSTGERGYAEKERPQGSYYYGLNKPNSERELSFVETRNMLLEKARGEIRKKLAELSLGIKENGREDKKVDRAMDLLFSPVAINVPDPDFHNFDLDRTENFFEVDQVWAAYADGDGMPRFYARIQKVISLKPFKVQISWLNSRTTAEFSSQDWIGSGFTKTCGDFRAGRIEINRSLNSFSHRVAWMKGPRGVIRIFPIKGEVWALYRNWSPDWTDLTPKEVVHKYEMVEVLEDYDEELGIPVAPLVKVAGFRTVFHRHMDPKEVRRIPREEMLRFSHQVPSYLLTGQEAQNAPKGCRELDPAAMPLDLLQVISEVYP
ncbi:uncharacterized protein LOC116204784 [Punica granatum]|uniref:Uncharacterized protein LOC116204784 n=1 Tax=Punica granatum TaxID=22663 RepID=A0A6P8DHY1_PUNGR|nr:uncharacterized protein LOC116204784 [Punica granatum]XP_031392929.1 uncharacterized protein LOC116204784 [Punica granatum]XP_031392930.1 uncharacterized protein LOC116204784 [Punica granatum]XP_031392931.1 uncharacterized protein LOC116204784 [Punica granatum]XP_031392932.1 uncharacterized protein LOC116204784 [Punica granatum]